MRRNDMSKQRRASEMFPIVAQYDKGDHGKKELCALHNLRASTFDYWLRRYREDAADQLVEPSFVKLDLYESPWPIEIILGVGIVRFSDYPPVDYLKALLAEV